LSAKGKPSEKTKSIEMRKIRSDLPSYPLAVDKRTVFDGIIKLCEMTALALLLVLLCVACVTAADLDCPLILKKHAKIDGLGVYAGRDYKAGEVVERCVTVSIPQHKVCLCVYVCMCVCVCG
jgi:hypothetical protein